MALQNFSFIRPELAGSDAPYETADLLRFVENGISHIFVLTPEMTLAEKLLPDLDLPLKTTHIPIFGVPNKDQIEMFYRKMLEIKERGEKAVVHCQFGQERTGIFLAYYLCKHYKLSLEKAIKEVQSKRPSSLRSSNSLQILKELCG